MYADVDDGRCWNDTQTSVIVFPFRRLIGSKIAQTFRTSRTMSVATKSAKKMKNRI